MPLTRSQIVILALAELLILTIVYSYLGSFLPHNSDNATLPLEAHAVLRGNILLHSWNLPSDNFWSLDLPYYTIFSFFMPLDPQLMVLVPAFLYACLVTTATLFMILSPSPSQTPFFPDRLLATFFVTVVLGAIMPPLQSFIGGLVLTGPNHICTYWYLLLLLWLRGYKGENQKLSLMQNPFRSVIRVPAIFSTILWTLLLIGDPMILSIGVIPFLFVEFALAWKKEQPWNRFLITFFSILTAFFVAKIFYVIRIFAGFHLAWKINTDFIDFESIPSHLLNVFNGLLNSYGANIFGHSLVVADTWVRLVRFIFLLSILFLAFDSMKRLIKSHERIEGMDIIVYLTSSIILIDLMAVLLSQNSNVSGIIGINRFLVPFYIFGTILLGVKGWSLLEMGVLDRIGRSIFLVSVTLMIVGAVSEFFAGWGLELRNLNKKPDAKISISGVFENPFEADQRWMGDWLVKKGLKNGYAQYWNAQIVSVITKGCVTVAPIKLSDGNYIPNPIFISSKTYSRISHKAPLFVITGSSGIDGVDQRKIVSSFGNPDKVKAIGRYKILVWEKGIKHHHKV